MPLEDLLAMYGYQGQGQCKVVKFEFSPFVGRGHAFRGPAGDVWVPRSRSM